MKSFTNLLALVLLACSPPAVIAFEVFDGKSMHRSIDISDLGEKIAIKEILGPCFACKTLARSIHEGLKRTERNRFDGGDSEYEKRKMGSYENSEIRLIEIQEHLCEEVVRGKEQCIKKAEELESEIEDWFFNHRQDNPDFHKYFCIEKRKYCCPSGHYGKECVPCLGGAEKPCWGRGICRGDGTRKGNGTCRCNEGHQGDECDTCSPGYVRDSDQPDVIKCIRCHESCQGNCFDKTPKGCEVCKVGYIRTDDYGCMDIDECNDTDKSPCTAQQFCMNTEGSYRCNDCDKSCNGCTSFGRDNCIECAADYYLKDGNCINDEQEAKNAEEAVEMSRKLQEMLKDRQEL